MRGFLAAFYKDMKLMMNGTGIFTLVFSLLLVPVFVFGTRDLSVDSFVQPFPVAVRDLDKTFMSRSLISQLREIELFSELRVLDEGVPDDRALQEGCAAVITVPQDFFYAMYTARECPVDIALNRDRPLEATLLRSVVTSVLDIVSADQAAWRGAFRFVYGDLSDAQQEILYEEASKDIFLDALGRQNVFTTEISASDVAGAVRRRLAAILMPMLAMLFAVAAFSTLPGERDMGTISRLRAFGAPVFAFRLSKVLTAVLWAAPMFAVLYVISGVGRIGPYLLLSVLTLFASFSVMHAIVTCAQDESAAKRWCNLYLLMSLFFSGTLLSAEHLPAGLSVLRNLIIGHFVHPVLNAMAAGESGQRVCLRMLPLFFIGAAALVAALPVGAFRARGVTFRAGTAGAHKDDTRAGAYRAGIRMIPVPLRFLQIVAMKIRIYTGGRVSLVLICVICLLCGLSCGSVRRAPAQTVTVAVADHDQSAASEQLYQLIVEKAGDRIRLFETGADAGTDALLDGSAEGLLVIPEGYGETVAADGRIQLSYQGTASAFTAQGVREVIAGQVAVQRASARARREAEKLSGYRLSTGEMRELEEMIRDAFETLPVMYRVTDLSGAGTQDPFTPDRLGYLSIVLVLLLMTFAAFTGRRDAAAAERRLNVTRTGRLLTCGADQLALCLAGLLATVCFLAPGGVPGPGESGAVLLLLVCVAAFTLALTKMTAQAGRVDALAPVLTLLICLLGGCFLDFSVLPGNIVRLMMISPAGAALLTARGSTRAAALLFAEAAVFLAAGWRKRK